MEHFRDSCGGVISWLDKSTSYTAFSEGWALYAENPLVARDTDAYEKEPLQKYGMLKWQVRDIRTSLVLGDLTKYRPIALIDQVRGPYCE